MEQQPEEPKPEIIINPEQMAGTWANFAQVSHSPYEFTLDFCRLDFGTIPPSGIVVSRVSVSPLFISQLIEALTNNWQLYARKALPQEVYGDPTLRIQPETPAASGQPPADADSESEDNDDA